MGALPKLYSSEGFGLILVDFRVEALGFNRFWGLALGCRVWEFKFRFLCSGVQVY